MKPFTRAKKGASAPFPPDQHERLIRAMRDIYESRKHQP